MLNEKYIKRKQLREIFTNNMTIREISNDK